MKKNILLQKSLTNHSNIILKKDFKLKALYLRVKVEEMLMYNSQHTAKFEFSRPELRVRLLFWFCKDKKCPSDSKTEDSS